MQAKNNYKVPLEIAFWVGLYILWVLVFQNRTITITRTIGIEFCYLVFIALNYYFTINYLIPTLLNKNKYVSFITLFSFSTAIAALLRALVSYYITIYLYSLPAPDFAKLFPNSLLNIFIWTSVLVAGKMIIDRRKNLRYLEEVEKEKIKNELDFLKAQHNPHFLFNSLNSLYFQIDKTNTDARGTLMKLSEMLRYQLYECAADRIPVDKELSYLKSYVELQRQRLDKNYNINFSVDENVRDFEIAPLLIIPLVENSFKHISHYTNKPNEINITLSYRHNTFICKVNNTTEQTEQNGSGGIGLKNLERRLELLYPEKFELNAVENNDRFDATLKITTGEN
ncbi:MAG TPA: histidine kinase [Bacteroidia bacterium]|jgi:two-component system LytT family sensor kinase|nr:histidine kinase [Bacteroidia bacterium]